MNEFQERLKELLEDNELSRLKLAGYLNISSEAINGYFNKNYYPEISIARKIAKYFKCSLDFLFGLTDNINNNVKNNLTFFQTVELLIKQRKISIAKAMKEMGISEYNYYRWRDGTKPLTSMIIILAKYFDVSVDYLVHNLDK
ncbi:MAG: helix-turn-helix transcriptional regulator [Clostridia bacterium]|nr:helix-turn-helix transcriptional regulator [Clostridia bacterium]